jgi:Fur family ferric uptake transcriptional regulator
VDRSTVYRTLELLRDMGLVSQVQVAGDPNQYELAVRSPHHHLVCKGCRRVFDVDASEVEGFRQRLLDRHGFVADIDHLVLEGYCGECVAERSIH